MRAAVDALLGDGVEAIAVRLLFSFLNPTHEHRVREHIAAVAPKVAVSLSSEVDPAFREYERTVVTALDAYVKPRVDRYLGQMAEHLSCVPRSCLAASHAVARRSCGRRSCARAAGTPVPLRACRRRSRRFRRRRARRLRKFDHHRCRGDLAATSRLSRADARCCAPKWMSMAIRSAYRRST